MTKLLSCLDLTFHIHVGHVLAQEISAAACFWGVILFCMVAERLVALVAWLVGFTWELRLAILAVVTASAASAGAVTAWIAWQERVRRNRIIGRWTRILRKLRAIRKRQRYFAYLGAYLKTVNRNLATRLKTLWLKTE